MVPDDSIVASTDSPSNGSALLRLVWMVAMPFILLCIFVLADKEPWTLGAADIVLVLLVVAAITARAIDALHYGGTTAQGEPATRSHVTGYAVRLVLLAGVAWFVAQSIAI